MIAKKMVICLGRRANASGATIPKKFWLLSIAMGTIFFTTKLRQ